MNFLKVSKNGIQFWNVSLMNESINGIFHVQVSKYFCHKIWIVAFSIVLSKCFGFQNKCRVRILFHILYYQFEFTKYRLKYNSKLKLLPFAVQLDHSQLVLNALDRRNHLLSVGLFLQFFQLKISVSYFLNKCLNLDHRQM